MGRLLGWAPAAADRQPGSASRTAREGNDEGSVLRRRQRERRPYRRLLRVRTFLLSDLNDSDNTFVVVQSDEDDPAWFTSVAVLDEGGYEIVRRDAARNEHEVAMATSANDIARDLTIRMAARDIPGRLTRYVSEL